MAARLRQAESRRVIAGADRLPSLGADAGSARSRTGQATPASDFSLGLNLSWEIDLWGRLRDRSHAADLDRDAAAADQQAARLSLAANTGKAWLNVIEAEQQVALSERTRKTFAEALAIVEQQFDRGLQPGDGGLAVSLSRANLASSEATVQARLRERDQARRALETLLGHYPAGRVPTRTTLPGLRSPVSAGLPADLLLRRPDLQAAERRYAAATARIGEARKNLLPSVALTASGGYASAQLAELVQPTALLARLAGNLAAPLFEGGRRRAEVALTQAQRDEIASDYAATALRAFREVETALAAEKYLQAQVAALARAAAAATEAEKTALDRYSRAQSDIVTVLESQRRAFDTQAALLRAQNALLQNRLDLYLALGGAE